MSMSSRGSALIATLALVAGMAPSFSAVAATPAFATEECAITVPATAKPGQRFDATVTFKNTGSAKWVSSRVALSTPGLSTLWTRHTVRTNSDVLPGQSYTYRFDAIAPKTAGIYEFSWQMRDGSKFFGPACKRLIYVGVPTPAPEQGNLYVTNASSMAAKHILAGTPENEIMKIKFRAEQEDIWVRNIELTSMDSEARSVDRLELFKAGEVFPFAFATRSGCGAKVVPPYTFCAVLYNQELVIPVGQTVEVAVRARLLHEENGAFSGEKIRFALQTPTSVVAQGMDSTYTLLANDNDNVAHGEVIMGTPAAHAAISSASHTVVLAKIASVSNASTDPERSAILTGISAIGQFSIGAAANFNSKNGYNDVIAQEMKFGIIAQNVLLNASSFKLYNKADASRKADCYVTGGTINAGTVTGNPSVICTNLFPESTLDTRIEQNTSADFVLEAEVLNANTSVNGSSRLRTTLQLGNAFKWYDGDTSYTYYNSVDYIPFTVQSTTYQN